MEPNEFTELDVISSCRTADMQMLRDITRTEQGEKLINFQENIFGWTPLFRCVMTNKHEMAKFLLEIGADPNIPTKEGDTPLHHACSNNQYKVTKVLLEFNANPDILNDKGDSPLHCACLRGHAAICELLLRNHANVNIQNNLTGDTPLHVAYDWSRSDVTQVLDLFGANFDIKNNEGKTPSDLALKIDLKKMKDKFSSKLSSSSGSVNCSYQIEDHENQYFEDLNNKVSCIRMESDNDRCSDISNINPLVDTCNNSTDNISEYNQEISWKVQNKNDQNEFCSFKNKNIIKSFEPRYDNSSMLNKAETDSNSNPKEVNVSFMNKKESTDCVNFEDPKDVYQGDGRISDFYHDKEEIKYSTNKNDSLNGKSSFLLNSNKRYNLTQNSCFK